MLATLSGADEPCWTVKDMVELLKVSRSTIYKMVDSGDLPAFRIHPGASRSSIRFRPARIRLWLEQRLAGGRQ